MIIAWPSTAPLWWNLGYKRELLHRGFFFHLVYFKGYEDFNVFDYEKTIIFLYRCLIVQIVVGSRQRSEAVLKMLRWKKMPQNIFLFDSVTSKPPEVILWFIRRHLAMVVLNAVPVNSGSAAAKHTDTIKLNLSQPFAAKKQYPLHCALKSFAESKDAYSSW